METAIVAQGNGKPVNAPKEPEAPQKVDIVSTADQVEKPVTPVKVDVDQVDFGKVVTKVTEIVQQLGTKVAFRYDERSSQPVIRVFDENSGELIRQIPREEMLDLMAKLRDISGIIFHDSV